jgi:hypothetical protein
MAKAGHIADLEAQYEMARLNTYVSKELNRRHDHRPADGWDTKTDQVQEALQV